MAFVEQLFCYCRTNAGSGSCNERVAAHDDVSRARSASV